MFKLIYILLNYLLDHTEVAFTITVMVLIYFPLAHAYTIKYRNLKEKFKIMEDCFNYLIDSFRFDTLTREALTYIIRNGGKPRMKKKIVQKSAGIKTPIPTPTQKFVVVKYDYHKMNMTLLNGEDVLVLSHNYFTVNDIKYKFTEYGLMLKNQQGRFTLNIFSLNTPEEVSHILLKTLVEHLDGFEFIQPQSKTKDLLKATIVPKEQVRK